jgi:hypothetical protein
MNKRGDATRSNEVTRNEAITLTATAVNTEQVKGAYGVNEFIYIRPLYTRVICFDGIFCESLYNGGEYGGQAFWAGYIYACAVLENRSRRVPFSALLIRNFYSNG